MIFTETEIRFIRHKLGLDMNFNKPSDRELMDLIDALDETPNDQILKKAQSCLLNEQT